MRYAHNPILSPEDLCPSQPSMQIECLLNPGVFRYDGKVWMLVRVAERPAQAEGEISFPVLDAQNRVTVMRVPAASPELDLSDPRVINYKGEDFLTTMSHLRLVSSTDGIRFREEAGYPPLTGSDRYEAYGIEDCRVTQIGTQYYLTYTAVSANGVAVRMRSTSDWRRFTDYGLVLPPHNKDCTLFDEKVGDLYYMLHRPSSPEIGGNYIWIAQSPDLRHWGNHRCVARTRKGMWDSARIGAGCAPIRTGEGWLMIYHGADASHRYCLGAMLLDAADPSKVLARSRTPVMEPEEPYELEGFFGNVIFTNGHLVDGDRIALYYGASDKVICRADLSVGEVLENLRKDL